MADVRYQPIARPQNFAEFYNAEVLIHVHEYNTSGALFCACFGFLLFVFTLV